VAYLAYLTYQVVSGLWGTMLLPAASIELGQRFHSGAAVAKMPTRGLACRYEHRTMSGSQRVRYNVEVDWKALPSPINSIEGIPDHVTSLHFWREKKSHRGIGRLTNLRHIVAHCVNQECLEEIVQLPELEMLYIDGLTATDLSCIRKRNDTLRHLIIKRGTKVSSLAWLDGLPSLRSLLLEHFKLVTDISPVSALEGLTAFGYEGSMWTTQRVDSLRPISELPKVESLFFANCRPKNDGLKPLHRLRRLRYLEIAAFYPDAEFMALRKQLPALECDWFDVINQYGSIKGAFKANFK
jgi:hypothetical protein